MRPRGCGSAVIGCLGLFSGMLLAQDIIGAGYASPVPFRVAPGQRITVFVRGLNLPPQMIEADRLPLPTSLAGISVTLAYQNSLEAVLLPLFSVEPIAEGLVGITLQLPFDLKMPSRSMGPIEEVPPRPVLIINQDRRRGRSINVNVAPDNIHVVNRCDKLPKEPQFVYRRDHPCVFDSVAHADGTLVSSANPALVGETVTVHAVGLGNTNAGVKAGERVPADAPLTEFAKQFRVCFDFIGAKQSIEPSCQQPSFVGLAPGEVGLYHIRIALPDLPPETPSCSVPSNFSVNNVKLTIRGPFSQDEAHLCVQRRSDDRGTAIESAVPGLTIITPGKSLGPPQN